VAFGRLVGNGVSVIQKVGKVGAVPGLPYRASPSPPSADPLPVKPEPEVVRHVKMEAKEEEKQPRRMLPALVPIVHHSKAKPNRYGRFFFTF